MTFSTTLQKYTDDIENPFLQDSLQSLGNLSGEKLNILAWGNEKIAVTFNINVDLPSLKNFEDLDIRTLEPIIIVFDTLNYPDKSPNIHTDRLDFPKNDLAHLYIAANDRPPAICYVRENVDEWYANKRIEDVIIRISNWFRAAALGELTEDGEQFEPMRLEGYYSKITYDYDMINDQIIYENPFPTTETFSMAQFQQSQISGIRTYNFVKKITPANIKQITDELQNDYDKKADNESKKNLCLAFILWNDENIINSNYSINLPRTWNDFKLFCDIYKIKWRILESIISESALNKFPVLIGIRRPKPIIGYSSNLEFINFEFNINNEDVKDGKIVNSFSINLLSHQQPLTIKQAEKISGYKSTLSKGIVFGCGALGSKIIMHFAKNGITNLTLLDHDYLSPHNITRHALMSDSIGENKASSLSSKIIELYPYDDIKIFPAPSFKDGLIYKEETFKKFEWLFDFTASDSFFNKIVTLNSINSCRVASASISDYGNLGILYTEGENRNPRVDDLQAFLFSLGVKDVKISEWLVRENTIAKNTNLMVRVGVGCNSETTLLADEKVSSYSSYFAGILKKEINLPNPVGQINLNRIIENDDIYSIETQTIKVQPFDIFSSVNSKWIIRLKNGILDNITDQATKAGELETGGVLMGVCNYKTKMIYVTDIINAPIDSKANASIFLRGFKNLSLEIDDINKSSGAQIGYVGEWHSHPHGPNVLSTTDMESVWEHKSELETLASPLPVFLSIITPSGFYPFVYE